MNSNYPNKLAWKGSDGPWHATRRIGQISAWDLYDAGKEVRVGTIDSNIMGPMRIEANAHMASAAPEAIEFIADLLVWIDNTDFTQDEVREKIARAEEILKKAYNH